MTQSPWLRQTSDRFAGDAGRRAGADSGAVDDAAPTEATARADVFIGPARYGVTGVRSLGPSNMALGDFAFTAAVMPAIGDAGQQRGSPVAPPSGGGFSLNLATGQNASGVIQTSGDLADAHWIVSNSDNYKQAPIAFTVAPDDVDWYPSFKANGPNSSWIAADPDNVDNGEVTYTITFDLTGYNPADATLVGGQFVVGDAGTVYLNGHVIGSEAYNQFVNFNPLSSGAGDFVAGINTLVIQTTMSDKFDGAARFEGTVVDTVTTNPPGPIHWAGAVSGNFSTAADWTGGLVPSANNDAILDASGATAYTVTASSSQSVNSIQTAATATLSITQGVFSAAAGTGSGANAGAIHVGYGATLSIGGKVANSGVIVISGGLIFAQNATLSGGGLLGLNGFNADQLVGGASAVTLTNVDNTIVGSGTIGSSNLTLMNATAGVIDASGGAGLFLTGVTDNAGLIEATGAGGLTIEGTSVDGSAGGTLLAANGSEVVLLGGTLIGGTLESEGSGLFRVRNHVSMNALDGTDSAVTNTATVRVGGGAALTLEGALDNTGRVELRGLRASATLVIGAPGVTLSGGGRLTTDDNANNAIVGATSSATLTNVDDTIMGAGALGGGTMILVNEAAGIIDGDYAAGLTIDTGANAVVNAGLIEATRDGALTIDSALDNEGTLLAIAKGTLTLRGDVTGAGTARIRGGGVLDAAGAFNQSVDFADRSGTLELAFSQSYGGTISGFSRRGATSLDLGDIAFVGSGEATWSGGVLTVTDGTHTARLTLAGDYAHVSFVASDDGHGGTLVVVGKPGAEAPAAPLETQAHRFTAAMASLAHPAAETAAAGHASAPAHLLLTSPRLRYA